MFNLSIDEITSENLREWSVDSITPMDELLSKVDFEIIKRYAALLKTNIHVVSFLDGQALSKKFSVISVYQSGVCRYFSSEEKKNSEILSYSKMLLANSNDVFFVTSSILFDKIFSTILIEAGSEKDVLFQNRRSLIDIGRMGKLRDVLSFKEMEDWASSKKILEQYKVFSTNVQSIPFSVYQVVLLLKEIEKYFFKFGFHLFFHDFLYPRTGEESIAIHSTEKEIDALNKYEQLFH